MQFKADLDFKMNLGETNVNKCEYLSNSVGAVNLSSLKSYKEKLEMIIC